MAAGVTAGRYGGMPALVFAIAVGASGVAGLAVARRHLKVILLFLVSFILGAVLMITAASAIKGGVLPRLAAGHAGVEISGRVVSPLLNSPQGSSFFVEVGDVKKGTSRYVTKERLLVRLDSAGAEGLFFPGARIEAAGVVREPTKDREWLFDHGAACSMSVSTKRLKAVGGLVDPVSSLVHGARTWMSRACGRLYAPRIAGFVEGVTLSKQDRMDGESLADLRACGLGHLVAVAGLHVGSAAMLALALLTVLGAGRRTTYIAACSAALFVVAVSNFRPSAMRASIMAGACFAGVLAGRDYDSLVGLDLAGVIILCANPRALFDQAFQFSFAAALGIVLAVRHHQRSGGAGGLRLFLAISAGAQLGIVPLMLIRGQTVPVTAVAANLLAIPLIGAVLMLGWSAACLSCLSLALGRAVALPVSLMARFVLAVASSLASVPRSGLVGGSIAAIALILYLGALVGFILQARNGGSLFKPAVACLLSVLLVLVPCASLPGFTSGNRLTILDIGEGDAILVQDAGGATVLIDGGPNGPKLIEKLRARGVRKLDLVVSTHPHMDHISGLIDALIEYPVGRVLDPGLSDEAGAYGEMLRLARDKRVQRVVAREGMVVQVSSRTELEVLYAPGEQGGTAADANDCSLVLMVRLAGMRALMTGDIGSDDQQKVLDYHPDLSCDVLKVPHHGAREATNAELYAACRPALAAISVGKENKFGHPSPSCLEKLADRRIRVVRTDREGDLVVSVDNDRIGLITGRR